MKNFGINDGRPISAMVRRPDSAAKYSGPKSGKKYIIFVNF